MSFLLKFLVRARLGLELGSLLYKGRTRVCLWNPLDDSFLWRSRVNPHSYQAWLCEYRLLYKPKWFISGSQKKKKKKKRNNRIKEKKVRKNPLVWESQRKTLPHSNWLKYLRDLIKLWKININLVLFTWRNWKVRGKIVCTLKIMVFYICQFSFYYYLAGYVFPWCSWKIRVESCAAQDWDVWCQATVKTFTAM